jgi:hypothetical protein
MTKRERITKRVEASGYAKAIANEEYYDVNDFIDDGMRYIKAIKEGRMIVSIGSVSQSGMSRTMKFLSCEKNKYYKGHHNYTNYWMFFRLLGYSKDRSNNRYFRIHGCGMDMVFDTNYNNIHNLCRLGFIDKKTCAKLAQETPPVV